MLVAIAISNTKDPLNGRFVPARKVCSSVVTVGTSIDAVSKVDLIAQRDGGPYIRVRMDLEAAKEISDDLKNSVDRARAFPAPSGAYHAFLVVRVQFDMVKGCVSAEVITGSDQLEEANTCRDQLEEANTSDLPVLYCVIPGRRP